MSQSIEVPDAIEVEGVGPGGTIVTRTYGPGPVEHCGDATDTVLFPILAAAVGLDPQPAPEPTDEPAPSGRRGRTPKEK